MSDVITCVGCGQKLRAKPTDRVRCPRCGQERAAIPVGKVALPCPECGVRAVETAAKLQVVRGFLIFSRRGSYTVIGCGECVSSAARSEAIKNFLFGWWCIPWGLLAPIYAIQNLMNAGRRPNPTRLGSAIAQAGLDLDDITIGADGMTGLERRFLQALCRILGQVVATSGAGSPEWRTAQDIVIDFSERRLTHEEASDWLERYGAADEDDRGRAHEDRITDSRDRIMLLRLAIEVAMADGAVDGFELKALSLLATRLRLSPQEFNRVLNSAKADRAADAQQAETDRESALRTLGLTAGASRAEIRIAYRELMLVHHPDLAPPEARAEATARAARINDAYDTLLGAR